MEPSNDIVDRWCETYLRTDWRQPPSSSVLRLFKSSDTMAAYYRTMQQMQHSAHLEIDDDHEWDSVAGETPPDLSFSIQTLKDLLQVINTLDVAGQAFMRHARSRNDAANLMGWFHCMSQSYLRSYIGALIRQEAIAAWVKSGEGLRALSEVESPREAAHYGACKDAVPRCISAEAAPWQQQAFAQGEKKRRRRRRRRTA